MKIVCVLVSFILVNVLACDLRDFLNTFRLTNVYIQKAHETNYDEENALEIVIKDIVTEDVPINNLMDGLNLTFGVSVEFILAEITQAKIKQEVLLNKIQLFQLDVAESSGNSEDLVLEKLAETRRNCIGEAVENILKSEQVRVLPFCIVCRMIGVLKNTKHLSIDSSDYIKTAWIDNFGRCALKFTNQDIIFYIRIQNQIIQVWLEDDTRREPLFTATPVQAPEPHQKCGCTIV